MSFRVGQKVVCVYSRDENHLHDRPQPVIPRGDIITVRCIREHPFTRKMLLSFYEHPEGPLGDWGFLSDDFRPIDYSFGEKVCEEITKVSETETIDV